MRRLTTTLVSVVALCCMAFWASSASALPPKILSTSFFAVKTDSVTLRALIDPEGKATLYHFEYGPEDCSANACTSIPVPDEQFPAGKPEEVRVEVKGLAPATTYHFRVLAENPQKEKAVGPDETFTTYLPPQEFDPCPNDQLRKENPSANPPEYSSANLPDCRVYEQVSPTGKNAGDITGYVPVLKASPSGDRVTFSSSTGVPGADGAQEIPIYLATRGANGWSTQGMFPPASEGQDAFVLGWTPDLSWVFSEARKLGAPIKGTLLARPSSGGAPKTIVDHTDNFISNAFAGASADASEVLFESKKALLPGAVEGKSNLYLWQRQSEELFLAGVLNTKEAPPEGAFAGSYDWVSGITPATLSRGGSDRGYYTRDQHVISEDGSKVYFTAAGTGQLYLRLNPAEEQSPLDGEGKCTDPDLACTINISASRKTNGVGPDGTDAAGTRPAAFLGASADGSVAYFTSSEKLTNDANTGPEPTNPPAIARAELDGSPLDLKFLPAKTREVATRNGFLYGITGKNSIFRCALAECQATLNEDFIPNDFTANPRGLAITDTHLYWTNEGQFEEIEKEGKKEKMVLVEASIGRALISGADPEQAFIKEEFVEEPEEPPETLVSEPRGIDVDGTHIYWVNGGIDSNLEPGVGYVTRAEIDGDPASVVSKFQRFASGDVAINATHLYYSYKAANQGVIRRTNINGGGAEENCTFFTSSKAPSLALSASHLYWTNYDASAIGRDDLDCTNPEQEFIKDAGNPQGLALDSTHLYWAANQEVQPNPGNDLYRYEADTDTLSDLIPDAIDANGIDTQGILGTSQDGSVVYLAANGVPGGVANSPNARGESATPGTCKGELGETISPSGVCNLYLWQEGAGLSFIARLDISGGTGSDAVDWVGTALSVFPEPDFQRSALVTPDGQALLFSSRRRLSDYANEGAPQLYRYRAGEAGLSCVTCNPTGKAPREPGPPFGIIQPFGTILPSGVTPPVRASYLAQNLSDDGNRVFFQSVEPLALGDTNGEDAEGKDTCEPTGSFNQRLPSCLDIYEWEAQGTGSCESDQASGGCLYLISSGKSTEPTLIGTSSASGGDVFFFTREHLVGQDEDNLIDIYTARENGGLASQNQPPPAICESGNGCLNAPAPPPPAQSPGTEALLPGNPKAKTGCPKGKHRVKGRCISKRKGKAKGKRGAKQRASAKGRAGR